jgi:hypothetical protein
VHDDRTTTAIRYLRQVHAQRSRAPPGRITVDGKVVEFGGHAAAEKAARAYMRSPGLAYKPVTTYV